MSNITISDIAREAGVSKATVSRVLNNPSIVDRVKRERVREVIEKYHYQPSALARDLSVQKTSTIGILVPELDNPFFGSILRGALELFNERNYMVVCFNSDEKADRDIEALQDMRSYHYSGLLYTPSIGYMDPEKKKEINRLLDILDVPTVLMDRNYQDLKRFDAVYFDDFNAMREAASLLASAGHRKIGLLNSRDSEFLARIRRRGYIQGLKESGVPYQKKYDYVIPGYTKEGAYRKACEILAEDDRPTAIITGNNDITLGFLSALYEYGMHLSRDCVCIGLDRIEALDITGVKLDYILRDGYQLGKKAAKLILSRLKDPSRKTQEVALNYQIVIRNTEAYSTDQIAYSIGTA